MTHDDWQAAIAPKVDRIRNLHKELAATDLDIFVLFGSLSSQIGQIGQVNYAASNTFLDAFVQCRYVLDLPASVIDISEKQLVLAQLRSLGMQTLQEQDLFDALQLAIVRSLPAPSAAHKIIGNTTATTDGWVRGTSNPAHLASGFMSARMIRRTKPCGSRRADEQRFQHRERRSAPRHRNLRRE